MIIKDNIRYPICRVKLTNSNLNSLTPPLHTQTFIAIETQFSFHQVPITDGCMEGKGETRRERDE